MGCEGAHLEFPAKLVLDDVTLGVHEGDRIGIVGKNGDGKSTLLVVLAGQIELEGGLVRRTRGLTIGVLGQTDSLSDDATVGYSVVGDAPEYEWASDPRIREIISELIADIDWNAKVGTLSGGQRRRVDLTRLLIGDYDVIMMDEPTNHLDIRAIAWLARHLNSRWQRNSGALLCVTHDRWFLDKIAQRIIEIVNGKAEFYNGNYTFYAEEKQRRYEELRRQYEKNQKEIAHLQKAADDLHLWAFMGADKLHKRAFSMEKRIARLQTAEKPREDKKLSVRFRQKEFFGDEVLVLEDVAKSYGEKKLFSGIDELIEPGERIALIGDNGTGKSTLLRCITGEETPDRGWIHLGPAVKSAYLPQLVRFDDPSRNMVDTMLWEAKCDPQTARNRLAAFGFRGEDVFKTVSVLSGGEQSRLRLCILMRDDINFLMLDEPTNHLDLLSREWMEDALMDYSEALLFVSHDRWFIEKFATRIWCLHDGKIEDYRGGFAEWREYKARQEALQPPAKAAKSAAREEKPKKKTEPNRDRRRQRIERDIERAEASLRDIEAEMEKNASDYQKLLELGAQKDAAEESLETLYAEWETLAE